MTSSSSTTYRDGHSSIPVNTPSTPKRSGCVAALAILLALNLIPLLGIAVFIIIYARLFDWTGITIGSLLLAAGVTYGAMATGIWKRYRWARWAALVWSALGVVNAGLTLFTSLAIIGMVALISFGFILFWLSRHTRDFPVVFNQEQEQWAVVLVALALLGTLTFGPLINFATGRYRITGQAMRPALTLGEYILVNKQVIRNLQRGDIVIFVYPLDASREFVSRVIGLPEERIEIVSGSVLVNGLNLTEPYLATPAASGGSWTLQADEYFVMGDNRNASSDSRSWGPLKKTYVIGKAIWIYWPPEKWRRMSEVVYSP